MIIKSNGKNIKIKEEHVDEAFKLLQLRSDAKNDLDFMDFDDEWNAFVELNCDVVPDKPDKPDEPDKQQQR